MDKSGDDVLRVFRLQDREGRGPFKPGFTHLWTDDTDEPRLPTSAEEFGWAVARGDTLPAGLYMGTACRTTEGVRKWFTRPELRRLKRHGYHLFAMDAVIILAESDNQLLFARKHPLAQGAVPVSWGFRYG